VRFFTCPAEKQLWHGYLQSLPFRFLRQRAIGHYIIDFYCAQMKLVIEVDGESHFSVEGEEYDEERTKILEGYGLKVIRFTNREICENFDAVCAEIERIIHP
jgi:very-short-patch-repair endonuclease